MLSERFTDRARKVMALANQEAKRFNHARIDTEHILLGIVKEGSGVGANVLKNLDVDLRMVRLEVEKLVHRGQAAAEVDKLPEAPGAKRVLELAIQEAQSLNHNYVGTEHLVLGLLRESEGVAAQVLVKLGVSLEQVRQELVILLGVAPTPEAAERRTAALGGLEPAYLAAMTRVVVVLHGFEDELERLQAAKDEAVKAADYDKAAELRGEAKKTRQAFDQVLRGLEQVCQQAERLLEDLQKDRGA